MARALDQLWWRSGGARHSLCNSCHSDGSLTIIVAEAIEENSGAQASGSLGLARQWLFRAK